MMTNISWELNIKVDGGPQIAESDTLATEAYGEIAVIVPKNSNNTNIEVQPAALEQIKALLITASKYDSKLSYKLDTAANAKSIILDAPQFYLGAGMISVLDSAPKNVYVTNGLKEDVTINILVGRDATP